jgi:hypothetical protein
MRREHHDLATKGLLAKALHELDARHSRHAVIGDQEVEAIGFHANAGQRLPAIGHDLNPVSIALQREDNGERDATFVFREQDI